MQISILSEHVTSRVYANTSVWNDFYWSKYYNIQIENDVINKKQFMLRKLRTTIFFYLNTEQKLKWKENMPENKYKTRF